ncbi:hypothetical protein ABPG77_010366 [Micractinium sp. CCAP 211/92]
MQRLAAVKPLNVRSKAARSGRDAALSAQQESRGMLEAFFVGRALAEVLNERLGAALGDALAEFGKWDAETRQSIRELQEEVIARAHREMMASAGVEDAAATTAAGSSSSSGVGSSVAPLVPDLAAAADDLRAEVASARAVLQQIKQQRRQQQDGQPTRQP